EKKDPQLLNGLAADEDGGAKAARRIYAGAGDVDAEQMDRHQCESDDQAGEAGGRGLLRRSENDDDKQHGGNKLVGDGGSGAVATLRADAEAGLPESAARGVVSAVG